VTAKIIVTEDITIDGVIELGDEDPGLGEWSGAFRRGPEGDRFKHDELRDAGAILLGRKTYDAFAASWPNAKNQFAERINALPKYVVSHRAASWAPTSVIDGDLAAAMRALKNRVDGNILVYGSASLVHQLASLGLVDTWHLMIYPAVAGRGKRLFPGGLTGNFRTEEMRPLGDGIVLLRYSAIG
jgi:dihydrofolate reductase